LNPGAIKLLQRRLDQPIDFTRDTDIGFDRHSSTAQSSNLVDDILRQTVIRDIVDDDGKTASKRCPNLQNNLAACAPTLGKLECLFHFRERQNG
jgi:hypothetical protein